MNNNNGNSGLVIGVVMVLIFVAGFILGQYTANDTDYIKTGSSNGVENSISTDSDNNDGQKIDDGGKTVDPSMLTEGQRKLLKTLGVDTNNITITPEMIACAEAKVGADRVTEIQNGATPSFTEGAKLAACYSN